jgi:hypothetical protein
MASLLGKADSTIAGMSYREAMADVTPDYSDIYKAKAEGFEENQLAFQKAIGDYFDIQHADNNKLADELKEATTKAMQGLGTDYEGMELFNSHLTSMKDRMKALPKGKKGDFERSKIRAEMNQLLESSVGLDDTLTKVGTMINAGEFNKHTTDYPALLAISEGRATKEVIGGNLVYTYEDAKGKKQTIDRQGIEDALGQSDLEIDDNFIKQGPGAFELGKQGGKFNRNKSVNGYEKMFTSPAGLAANMNEKQGGLEYTFVESLAGKDGSESIYKALTNMGPTTVAQYDANNDGKITEADFAHPDNGIELIESLTDPRSDNYNFQAAKRAAAEFYADKIDQVEFNDGSSLRPSKTLSVSDQIKIKNLEEKQRKEKQTQIDARNTVYSIENEFSAGETTIGTGSRYVQKSEATEAKEAYTDIDGNKVEAVDATPASWDFFVNGKVEKSMPVGSEDILDEITKHITNTSGKYGTFEKYKSIENGHMYIGRGKWAPPGGVKEFPIGPNKSKGGLPPAENAEDGKYYKSKNGTIYYFTKKEGYKFISKE